MVRFCNVILELRKESGALQKDIANYLGVQSATVSRWECGKIEPDFDTLIKLANYFSVSTDYLLGNAEVLYKTEKENVVITLSEQEACVLFNFRTLNKPSKTKVEGFIEALK